MRKPFTFATFPTRLEPIAGTELLSCIREAAVIAHARGELLVFDFNDTTVRVDPEEMLNDYAAKLYKRWSDERARVQQQQASAGTR